MEEISSSLKKQQTTTTIIKSTSTSSPRKNEIILASEQVQIISQLLDKLFIAAHANNDINIILNQEKNIFVDTIQDLYGLSQRRNEKLYQLLQLIGKKIVVVKRNKNALYEDLKKLNKKLEKREKGIRRLSLQPPSATLTEDDLRIGEEFEEDLTDLLDELEDHEGISMKNLDATSWENIEEWTSEDVENADKRIRADTDWYKSYNDRLENVMLRENMDNIILHLKRLDVWNQQILYNVKTVPGVSEWAIEELNHRLNRASEKVASHYVSMRKTISDQVESFDDLELSNGPLMVRG